MRTPMLLTLALALGCDASTSSTLNPGNEPVPPDSGNKPPVGTDGATPSDAGSSSDSGSFPDIGSPQSFDSGGDASLPGDVYKAVFDAVSQTNLEKRLREVTGLDPVTVGTQTYQITNRWSATAKAQFRDYWSQYFTALGATVNVLPFSTSNPVSGETQGHDLEAILPGKSADTVVIIVHYDSNAASGKETQNPAADDDGSGVATQMESARIFSQITDRDHTVRFVAADYEELTNNEGGFAYVKYLQQEAATKGFQILVASDNDQTGWSCWDGSACDHTSEAPNTTFALITCASSTTNNYPELATGFLDVASMYSTMKPTKQCDNSGDTDHYPFWQAGIPAYVLEEWSAGNNPYYDNQGDTLATINLNYLWQISQIQITFQAKLMGIGQAPGADP